jgi:hypothetical protein
MKNLNIMTGFEIFSNPVIISVCRFAISLKFEIADVNINI